MNSRTQRVALRLTDDEERGLEYGLGDLTQETAPLLIHLDRGQMEQRTLIRLANPGGVPGTVNIL